jgi:hypothetical protein
VSITLAGGCGDGRPSEGDDVHNVERIVSHAAGRIVGTDAPEHLEVFQSPGRDRIAADSAGGDCGPLWCKYPYGNDTIDARDGEVDSITCGFGTDTVYADAVDVVDSDCETVIRGGAAPSAGAGGSTSRTLAASVVKVRLSRALSHGLTLRVTAPGAGRLSASAKRKGRLAASGARTVRKAGSTTVVLRFTKKMRATLRHARSAKLSVTVRFAPKRGAKVARTLGVTLR